MTSTAAKRCRTDAAITRKPSVLLVRRGGRAVECGGLEIRGYTCTDRHRCAFTPQIDRIVTAPRHPSAPTGTVIAVKAAVRSRASGVHPKIVSEMLGHSTIAITLDLYSHVTPTMQLDAAAVLDAVLRR
jgi:integrase